MLHSKIFDNKEATNQFHSSSFSLQNRPNQIDLLHRQGRRTMPPQRRYARFHWPAPHPHAHRHTIQHQTLTPHQPASVQIQTAGLINSGFLLNFLCV